jgi:NADP-dependent 3-hydroxy acid dehydrogenase YdfG
MSDSIVLHGEGTTMKAKGEKGVAAVVGVGAGLGAALARCFATGYKVALIARSADIIEKVAEEIRAAAGIAYPIRSDATIEEQVAATHAQIRRELGPIEILIYNGGRRPMGRLLETTPEVFEQTWRLHTFGAFLWARQVVPEMLSRGGGTILITGATAGVRPWPTSAAFAPAKFAVRGLAQVLARDLHPQGIHVAYINVDGGIDMPLLRKFRPEAKDEDLLKPAAIADAFWYLAHQDPSAWTHELDIRPFTEKF